MNGVSNLRNHGDQNGVDRSPQMRRGNLRRGLPAVEHEVDLSRDVGGPRDVTRDHDVIHDPRHVTIQIEICLI